MRSTTMVFQGKVGNLLDSRLSDRRYFNQDERTFFVNVRYSATLIGRTLPDTRQRMRCTAQLPANQCGGIHHGPSAEQDLYAYRRRGHDRARRRARVPKTHARIEAYGTVDEANSAIGMVLAVPEPAGGHHAGADADSA